MRKTALLLLMVLAVAAFHACKETPKGITGKWKLIGEECDAAGKCKTEKKDDYVVEYTASGKYVKGAVAADYQVRGDHLFIAIPGMGDIEIKIISLKGEDLLLQYGKAPRGFHFREGEIKKFRRCP